MFQFLRTSIQFIAPVFVICTMLNVGLTQKPSAIAAHLKNLPFLLKMLAANFIFAPLIMIGTLYLVPFNPAFKAGLLIFALGAGAPFLIKLTQTAEHDLALGAAVMMVLMIVTVPYVPLVLPMVLSGATVDAMAITRALLVQMLLPIGIGMLTAAFLPGLGKRLQPLAGGVGNIAMYAMVVATVLGYFPNLLQIIGTGAFLVALLFVAAAFGLGYLAGFGKDHLEDVGGLGTAQRNTAAGVIIAIQNFKDPNVFVMLTLANILGIVMLLIVARFLSRDNKLKLETL